MIKFVQVLKSGISINYEYDHFNRLISKKYPNNKTVCYEYNAIGNCIKIIDNNKITSFEYDIYGNIAKVTFPNSQSVQYLYDPFGRLLKLTYPDNSEVFYSYDLSWRLIEIKDQSGITNTQYRSILFNLPSS